jgi:hypothetical protein
MTHGLILLVGAMLFPVACLFLLLWLGWLEDTLDVDVAKTERRNVPAPVRAIALPNPTVLPEPVRTITVPQPRPTPAPAPAPAS